MQNRRRLTPAAVISGVALTVLVASSCGGGKQHANDWRYDPTPAPPVPGNLASPAFREELAHFEEFVDSSVGFVAFATHVLPDPDDRGRVAKVLAEHEGDPGFAEEFVRWGAEGLGDALGFEEVPELHSLLDGPTGRDDRELGRVLRIEGVVWASPGSLGAGPEAPLADVLRRSARLHDDAPGEVEVAAVVSAVLAPSEFAFDCWLAFRLRQADSAEWIRPAVQGRAPAATRIEAAVGQSLYDSYLEFWKEEKFEIEPLETDVVHAWKGDRVFQPLRRDSLRNGRMVKPDTSSSSDSR